MNAPERLASEHKAKFVWDDPLLLDEQLREEERLVRETARAYAQEKLLPRVTNAFRHEISDPSVFPLAIPIITGPGALTASVTLVSQAQDQWLTYGVLVACAARRQPRPRAQVGRSTRARVASRPAMTI